MNRVLFVSQDQSSAALQDAIRRCAGRWRLRTAVGAAQATEALAECACDVVIVETASDPSWGLEILAQAKVAQPETARIVLSDPIDPALLPLATEVAHQCVAKPCDPDQFWKLVERTTCLYGLMNNRVIRRLLGGLDRLPSVPRSYAALTQAMERAESSLADVVTIVERDTAMATKVLQLVNSAYFGRARHISSISVAVSLLGLERLKALALSTHVFGMLSDAESRAFGFDRLQERSLLTAQLARRYLSGIGRGEEGFAVGLLQDVGKLLLAVCLKDRYREVHEEALRREVPIEVVERERFDVSNAVVGACLLSVWGLPATIIEAVAFHHAPSGLLHDETALVEAVHVAGLLAGAILQGADPMTCELEIDPILMSRAGMEEKVHAWRVIAAEEFPAIPT